MINCKDCIHKIELGDKNFISCGKPTASPEGVKKKGVDKGKFEFPLRFDPKWAKECKGFFDKNTDLEKLSTDKLKDAFRKEFAYFSASIDINFQQVSPILMGTLKDNMAKFEETFERMGSKEDIEEYSREEIIELIPLIAAI